MTQEQKDFLESRGYKIKNGYIEQYIPINKEPKQYWSNRPKTIDFQIWGWQIVAHESKAQMLIDEINII